MKKKITAMFLSLIIGILLLLIQVNIVYAEQDIDVYPIWIGDIQITENNKNDVLGTADEGATVVYNPATKTLTLDGANIKEGKKVDKEQHQTYRVAIYSKIDINICLKGNNSLGEFDVTKYTVNNGYVTNGYSINYGIWTEDSNLTFVESDGSGTLNIVDYSDGIKANNITFNNKFGKLIINDKGEQPQEDLPPCAISASGDVIINGGEFDLKSELQNGITGKNIAINGGILKISSKANSIEALNSLNINDNLSVVNATYNKNETKELKAEADNVDEGYVTIKPKDTYNINITSSEIKIRVALSTDPEDDAQCIPDCEFFVDEQNPCNQDVKNDRLNGDVYVYIEPNFFTGGRISTIKINGESKDVSVPTGRNVYKLPSTNTYTIEVHGVEEKHYNIMWANDGANVIGTDYDDPEVLLQNGFAKVIKVYDNETDMNDITDEIEHSEEGCVDPKGKGSVQLAEGNVVIFEFTPKYGYQLTSVSANGTKLEAQETMNQYKYVMPATNIHFQATFTKTEDIVKSSTNKVKNGSIKLGQNEIDAGSSVLTVKDAVLTDEQKNAILEQAGEYKVSNILDIKLDQVFYKGSNNENDVWANPLGYENDLKSPAIITLKLEDGVDGDEIVLVHEKEDGTYEIIETEYDKENNTIIFKTKSFSNYAIAAKTTLDINNDKPTNTNDNPKTGDPIFMNISLMVIALVGLSVSSKLYKKNK